MIEKEIIESTKKQLFWLRVEMVIHFSWVIWMFSSMIITGYSITGTISEQSIYEWWEVVVVILLTVLMFVSGLRVGIVKYKITGIKIFLSQFVECDCESCVEKRKSQLN